MDQHVNGIIVITSCIAIGTQCKVANMHTGCSSSSVINQAKV